MAYLEFSTENGGSVVLETEEAPGALPVSALSDGVGHALTSIQSSFESIQEMANKIGAMLRNSLPDQPAEVEVTFGIKAAVELKALVVAKTGGEANFTVKMKWLNSAAPHKP